MQTTCQDCQRAEEQIRAALVPVVEQFPGDGQGHYFATLAAIAVEGMFDYAGAQTGVEVLQRMITRYLAGRAAAKPRLVPLGKASGE